MVKRILCIVCLMTFLLPTALLASPRLSEQDPTPETLGGRVYEYAFCEPAEVDEFDLCRRQIHFGEDKEVGRVLVKEWDHDFATGAYQLQGRVVKIDIKVNDREIYKHTFVLGDDLRTLRKDDGNEYNLNPFHNLVYSRDLCLPSRSHEQDECRESIAFWPTEHFRRKKGNKLLEVGSYFVWGNKVKIFMEKSDEHFNLTQSDDGSMLHDENGGVFYLSCKIGSCPSDQF